MIETHTRLSIHRLTDRLTDRQTNKVERGHSQIVSITLYLTGLKATVLPAVIYVILFLFIAQ